MLHLIGGDPGEGKTAVVLDGSGRPAHPRRGLAGWDPGQRHPGVVVILSAEDTASYTRADAGPARPPPPRAAAVLRQNSVRRQVIDLAGLIRRRSQLDDYSPAPPASSASPPLRRSPLCRPGEPGLAPPARCLQEDGVPAEGVQDRPTLLGRAVEGVGRLEAGSRPRVPQHRSAVAAAPLLRALDQALRSAHRWPPTRQC